jgi:predicted Zn-dependent peptidase
MSVCIKCGSRNETEETSGTAHFLEHLHFKVKKKYPVKLNEDFKIPILFRVLRSEQEFN